MTTPRILLAAAAAVAFLVGPSGASQVLGPLQAPHKETVVQAVIDAHRATVNSCDEDSLDKGRALLVDWAAQRLNAADSTLRWGRKSRGRPVDGKADRPNTDGLTYLRSDGKFEIYDVVSGTPPCDASWEGHGPFDQGQNGWWAPPQLGKEGGTTPIPPPPTPCPVCPPDREQLVSELRDEINAKGNRISVLEADLDTERRRAADLQQQLDNRPTPRCTASIFGIKIPCKVIQ